MLRPRPVPATEHTYWGILTGLFGDFITGGDKKKEPGARFVELLRTILTQKRGYLANRANGGIPVEPNVWGYDSRADSEGYTT